jgi:RNA polymerase sigma factor (sigma-70 family)
MQSRQGIIELFSTFLQFKDDRAQCWVMDSRLQRSMQNCLAKISPSKAEGFWVLYWHKLWQTQTQSLATAHLTAYLQEACYWVTKKIILHFAKQQSEADLFQTAIARVDRVLKGFNPTYGSNLSAYAEFVFGNVLKDALRQRQEVDICSDWALLHRVSQRKLTEALNRAGVSDTALDRYVLAWKCFQELAAPHENQLLQKLAKPDPSLWQAIADLYNAERLNQANTSGHACSSEQLQQWMSACAKAVRGLLYPSVISLNAPTPGIETTEWLDSLTQEFGESLLTDLIAQEEIDARQARQVQIQTVLADAIAQLDPDSQTLLQSYYAEELTQQQIAEKLQVKQYTVSRRLARLKQQFLLTLAQWSQETLHVSIAPPVLVDMSHLLEEWLIMHYRS